MKKLALLIFAFVSFSTFAASFTYRLYEDSVERFTPYTVTIELSGDFKQGSKLKRVTVSEGPMALFDLKDRTIRRGAIKYRWDGDVLVLLEGTSNFEAAVRAPVINGWGDTDINPDDKYSFYAEGELRLTPAGTIGETRFEIPNQSAGEMCMWGILKK